MERDIVDTGRLKESLEIKTDFKQTKIGFSVSYNTPYAAFVHYGGVMKPYGNKSAADVVIPARPWVQAVFEGSHGQPKFDMVAPFNQGIRKFGRLNLGRYPSPAFIVQWHARRVFRLSYSLA